MLNSRQRKKLSEAFSDFVYSLNHIKLWYRLYKELPLYDKTNVGLHYSTKVPRVERDQNKSVVVIIHDKPELNRQPISDTVEHFENLGNLVFVINTRKSEDQPILANVNDYEYYIDDFGLVELLGLNEDTKVRDYVDIIQNDIDNGVTVDLRSITVFEDLSHAIHRIKSNHPYLNYGSIKLVSFGDTAYGTNLYSSIHTSVNEVYYIDPLSIQPVKPLDIKQMIFSEDTTYFDNHTTSGSTDLTSVVRVKPRETAGSIATTLAFIV